jgi:hypothetical protein
MVSSPNAYQSVAIFWYQSASQRCQSESQGGSPFAPTSSFQRPLTSVGGLRLSEASATSSSPIRSESRSVRLMRHMDYPGRHGVEKEAARGQRRGQHEAKQRAAEAH